MDDTPTLSDHPPLEARHGGEANSGGASPGGVSALPQTIKADLEHLANLPDNWDECGGAAYPRPQLARIAQWWREFAREYHAEFSCAPPLPEIGQAEGQSIDLHWDGDFSFLVNVPEDENEPCTFYGFCASEPNMEFQGKSPLQSLGAAVKTCVRGFFDKSA